MFKAPSCIRSILLSNIEMYVYVYLANHILIFTYLVILASKMMKLLYFYADYFILKFSIYISQYFSILDYNATRPLSRCYLRSYLVKNTAGAHKEPSKEYNNNH